ncbi:galactokinase family protein, partial [bacterium]|nr:galactokinase family protein [bacterium]
MKIIFSHEILCISGISGIFFAVDKPVFLGEADAFKKLYGASPDVIVRSPGRVNIIGEHT